MKNKKLFYYILLLAIATVFFVLLNFFSKTNEAKQKEKRAEPKTEAGQIFDQEKEEKLNKISGETNEQETLLAKELESKTTINNQFVVIDEIKKTKEAKEASSSDDSKNPKLTPSISVVANISQKELATIVLENKSTGAQVGSGLDDEEKLIWTQIWNLRDATPIETDFFQLSFNTRTRFFDIYLKNNATQEQFYLWLTENNYQQIPKDHFVFMVI